MSVESPTTNAESKADAILRVGQELMQTRGYDAFSFRDVADRVGIKSASIHYHFPTKADLAIAVAKSYRTSFGQGVAAIDRELEPREQLRRYAGLFQSTLTDTDRICLCGMLASEVESLPPEVRTEIEQFFVDQEQWVVDVIEDIAGEPSKTIDPVSFAKLFIGALEGAMIVARSIGKPEHLDQVAEQLLGLLAPASG